MRRIGVVPGPHPSAGGVYQYSLRLLQELTQLASERGEEEYIMFRQFTPEVFDHVFHPPRIRIAFLRPQPSWDERFFLTLMVRLGLRVRFHDEEPKDSIPDPDRIHPRPRQLRWFRRHGVSWILYTFPWNFSFESGVPFAIPVHDLQHRLHSEFPEVSADGEWERREYLYRNIARKALVILVDSEIGREDVLTFYGEYGLDPDQVKVLPFLPPDELLRARNSGHADEMARRVRMRYGLPDSYLFYPAQFWPHKNHLRLIEALGLLTRRGIDSKLVLCGSRSGAIRERTYEKIQIHLTALGLEKRIFILGYVSDDELAGLYAGATALVFPTFFGPTNIPILEAWAYGCPVLTSDIRGIREQVGEAALCVDPMSSEAIADGIERIWCDSSLRNSLVQKGAERLASYTPAMFRARLSEAIDEANRRADAGRFRKNKGWHFLSGNVRSSV